MATGKKAASPASRKSEARTADGAAPWERENPKADEHHHLSPAQKAEARRDAEKAGRPYPNLVDNMRVARKARK